MENLGLVEQYQSEVEWLQARLGCVGGSDAGAILGRNPYCSPFQAWARIMGLSDDAANARMRMGQRLERVIKQAAEEEGGLTLLGLPRWTVYRHRDRRWQICTPDDFLADGAAGFEAKAVGSGTAAQWGDPPDGVPAYVRAQVVHSMAVTGLRRWYVGALLAGLDYRQYLIEATEDEIAALVAAETEFYDRYIRTRTAPPLDGSEAASEYIRRQWPQDTEPIAQAATPEEVAAFIRLREARRALAEAERERDIAEARIKALIGSRAGLEYNGERITFRAQGMTRTDWKSVAVALNAPESLVEQYTKRDTIRVLRVPREWLDSKESSND